jgi:Spy/CpxP family protein refolding chaperone
MRPRIKGAIFLLLAFGLGVVGGAVGLGLYHTRFGDWRSPEGTARFQDRILTRLTKELELGSEQRQKVEAVLKETGQEFARLRDEIGPRFREIRDRSKERIRAVLDAAQQTKFDTVSQEWERRIERWRGRGPGEGPPRKGP